MKLSAVVNTYNEEATIARALRSVAPYVDEIVVVDMGSKDATRTRAKAYTSRIFKHPYVGYVEPARNFAIKKATGDWILLLDADEVLPESLGLKLRKLAESDVDYYRLPRKNIIFGSWITHTGWWPDYTIRLFKKDAVSWNDEIHSVPITYGKGADLPSDEAHALTHYHYVSIDQYLERLARYTTQEAKQLAESGKTFQWERLFVSPANEFFTRFFAWEGYKDGVHGLALSLLQSFSMLIVEVKLWELGKFQKITNFNQESFLEEVNHTCKKITYDFHHWNNYTKEAVLGPLAKTIHKLKRRMRF
jgi:glycosyltransferase involved in cell wall biosynthesis